MSAVSFASAILLQSWGQEMDIDYSSDLAIVLFVLYAILMVGIGVIASRYQTDEEEYFAAGRRGGLFVIALSIFAGLQSGVGIIGNPGTIYSAGMTFFIMLLFIPAFYVVPYWLLGKKMRILGEVKGAITAPDAVYHRFKDERLRLLAATSVFLGCIGYLAAQYAALGMVMSFVLPFSFLESLAIGLLIVGAYTVIGGMLAAIWSDAIQGVLLVVAATLTAWFVITGYPGGWEGAMTTISQESPGFLSVAIPGTAGGLPLGLFISVFLLLVTLVGLPHSFTKFFMIKDVARLRWGALVTGAAYIVSTLFWFTVPIMKAAVLEGRVAALPTPDVVVPMALITYAPDVVVAFVLTGIIAAIMSTGNAFLNMGAAAILHDVAQENQGINLTGDQQVFWGRIVTVLILLASFAIAATFPGLIFTIAAAGWAIFASVLVPCVAVAWNWKGATVEGALSGASVGLGLTIVLAYAVEYGGVQLPMGFFGGQLAQIIGFVVFLAVSLVTSTGEYRDLDDPEVRRIIDVPRIGSDETTRPRGSPADD